MVRYEVLRFREVRQRVEDASRLLVGKAPFDIRHHADHEAQLVDALYDKTRGARRWRILEQLLGGGNDIFWRQSASRLARFVHDETKVLEVVVVEFK